MIPLTTNIADVPGVGPRRADAFRHLGIRCVADLVLHLPLRYEHELPEQTIRQATARAEAARGAEVTIAVRGELASLRVVPARRRRVEGVLQDDTDSLHLTWFNMPWLADRLHAGSLVRVTGRAKQYRDRLQMVNPRCEALDPEQPPQQRPERYRPVYPASEALASWRIEQAVEAILDETLAVASWRIEQAVEAILDETLAELADHLHPQYRDSRALPTLAEAYRMMHRPADADEAVRGRRRLAFDELLLLQLGVMLKRRHRRLTLQAPALKHNDAIDAHIVARFPFELTNSQRTVIDEIARDLAEATPMNRLLQGDVGAGKTVVALYGMLMAVASGHQAALMAPTELLAEQHGDSIGRMLTGARVTIETLTGSMTAAQRSDILERLENGAIDILIGTHALLTQTVQFKSLALSVIDEQHRFGVHQRATLRTKGTDDRSVPHTLVMTA
ncbi:MAG: DEAD/DEAH box helicase, partial [Planctomycetota bacterium]